LDPAKQHQAEHPEESWAEAALDEFAQITPNKVNQYLRWAVSKLHSHQHQHSSS
jgi:hypothetical protein